MEYAACVAGSDFGVQERFSSVGVLLLWGSSAAVGFGSWVLALHVLAFPLDLKHFTHCLPFVHCHHLERVRAYNREICSAWPTVGSRAPRPVATQLVDGVRWAWAVVLVSLQRFFANVSKNENINARSTVARDSAWKNEKLHCKNHGRADLRSASKYFYDDDTANNNLPRLANVTFDSVCLATSHCHAPSASLDGLNRFESNVACGISAGLWRSHHRYVFQLMTVRFLLERC